MVFAVLPHIYDRFCQAEKIICCDSINQQPIICKGESFGCNQHHYPHQNNGHSHKHFTAYTAGFPFLPHAGILIGQSSYLPARPQQCKTNHTQQQVIHGERAQPIGTKIPSGSPFCKGKKCIDSQCAISENNRPQ